MSIAPRHYIRRLGVSGIVILSSDWREEAGGYQHEHTVEEIVCRKEGKPHQMKIHWLQKFFPHSELDYTVQKDEEISEAEYERLCQEHGGILDTAEYYEKLAKRSEIKRQLEELRPPCPECQIPMVERSGRYGDFWGCPRYPKCKATRKLTASMKAKRRELWDQFEEYCDL